MEDFTAAIAVALEFAGTNGDTLVVLTSDHETGGMSLGRDDQYLWNPRPMRELGVTPAALTAGFLANDLSLGDYLAPRLPFELTTEERGRLDRVARDDQ